MEYLKEKTKELSSWLNPIISASVISFGASVLYVFRKGPYRAIQLARISKKWEAPIRSVRTAEIKLVESKLNSLTSERYVVVRGPKGVGKTCIVDTVLEKRPGVLRFDIPPGKSYDNIMDLVFSSVSGGLNKDLESCKSRTRGVLKWYNRFYGNYPFVIALQAKERFPPDPWAQIGPAARDLGGFGFRVLVDASQYALADKQTKREEYVDIDYMSKDQLFSIPEFQSFFKKLEDCGLKDDIWKVLGGDPNSVQRLVNACYGTEDIKAIVVEFLFNALKDTIRDLDTEKRNSISVEEAEVKPSDVKLLRTVHDLFVPSNPTIAFILRSGLKSKDLMIEGLSLQKKEEKLKMLVLNSKYIN